MTDAIKPALTAEEWANLPERALSDDQTYFADAAHDIYVGHHTFHGDQYEGNILVNERPHTLAAIALHGQPFGFTREDVAFLTHVALRLPEKKGREIAKSLAARIEALLPPEDTE